MEKIYFIRIIRQCAGCRHSGKNVPYYPNECEIVGIDISDKMLSNAKKKTSERNNASLFQMDAERLGFKDDTFGYVVTTFVLCSIPNPVLALEEMKRVCKPDGSIINLEHMKSEKGIIAFIEDLFNPITAALTGVNINRETVENIKKAGLNVITVKNMGLWDVFRLIRSKP